MPRSYLTRGHQSHTDLTKMPIASIIWIPGHKTEDCWPLKNKIQDLIDVGVIIIDLTNGKYEVYDQFKVHHISFYHHHRYFSENPLIIKALNLVRKAHRMNSHKWLKRSNQGSLDLNQS